MKTLKKIAAKHGLDIKQDRATVGVLMDDCYEIDIRTYNLINEAGYNDSYNCFNGESW